MTDAVQPRRTQAWFTRALLLALGAALVALAIFGVRETADRPTTIPYGEFLDQLDAGNVASVTFQGTQIDGHFKQPVADVASKNTAALTVFRSRVPDFGDPTLFPELRKQHATIGVATSQWFGLGVGGTAILGVLGAFLLAKPMLLFIAAAFVAGLVRVARGGKMDIRSTLSMVPMFRSVADSSDKQKEAAADSPRVGDGRAPKEDEMTDAAQRPWYMRASVWALGAVLLLGVAAFGVMEMINRPAAIAYGDFLDQLDANNVASVTFAGTQIDGAFKQPVGRAAANGRAPQTAFRSEAPAFGDPTLLPELRKQHVPFNVVSSSNWVSWLGKLPWPMVLLIGGLLIAGLIKLMRGEKAPVGSTSTHTMMGFITDLFGNKDQATNPPAGNSARAPQKARFPINPP